MSYKLDWIEYHWSKIPKKVWFECYSFAGGCGFKNYCNLNKDQSTINCPKCKKLFTGWN